ncbi:MAG: autotransporter outer membrane beta-barrel domain-containing protein [Desulfovibrio sp.]|nr:autotransporter outer membrane beta-barrel domain-containing protein [Desulfovibrio sp.]
MSFWGAGLYGGWKPGDFELSGDVSFLSTHNRISQELDPAIRMGSLSGNVNARALAASFNAGYTFRTEWLDVIPHIGVHYTWLSTDAYDIEAQGNSQLCGEFFTSSLKSFLLILNFF